MLVLAVNNLRANKQPESLEAPLSSIVGCILNLVDPENVSESIVTFIWPVAD
jgi:hypothetical protein